MHAAELVAVGVHQAEKDLFLTDATFLANLA